MRSDPMSEEKPQMRIARRAVNRELQPLFGRRRQTPAVVQAHDRPKVGLERERVDTTHASRPPVEPVFDLPNLRRASRANRLEVSEVFRLGDESSAGERSAVEPSEPSEQTSALVGPR